VTREPDSRPEEERAQTEGQVQVADYPEQVVRRSNGFVPLVLGGVIAAACGFGAALVALPDGWQGLVAGSPQQTAEVAARLESLEVGLAAQGSEISRLGLALTTAEQVAASGMSQAEHQEMIDAAAAELAARISSLEARVLAIESAPAGAAVDAGAIAALRAEIEAIRTAAAQRTDPAALDTIMADARAEFAAATERLEAERAARDVATQSLLAEFRTEVGAVSQDIRRRALLLRVEWAVHSGTPFVRALEMLAAEGGEVPAGLRDASGGVATLGSLQAAFPDAARAALAAGVSVDPETPFTERVAAFLRVQTGARSLAPRAGADPDAVLARAEAALRAGDLRQTLAELDLLSPTAAAAPVFAEWRGRAASRQAAIDALEGLQSTGSADDGG
jgi:hypothetical protein